MHYVLPELSRTFQKYLANVAPRRAKVNTAHSSESKGANELSLGETIWEHWLFLLFSRLLPTSPIYFFVLFQTSCVFHIVFLSYISLSLMVKWLGSISFAHVLQIGIEKPVWTAKFDACLPLVMTQIGEKTSGIVKKETVSRIRLSSSVSYRKLHYLRWRYQVRIRLSYKHHLLQPCKIYHVLWFYKRYFLVCSVF